MNSNARIDSLQLMLTDLRMPGVGGLDLSALPCFPYLTWSTKTPAKREARQGQTSSGPSGPCGRPAAPPPTQPAGPTSRASCSPSTAPAARAPAPWTGRTASSTGSSRPCAPGWSAGRRARLRRAVLDVVVLEERRLVVEALLLRHLHRAVRRQPLDLRREPADLLPQVVDRDDLAEHDVDLRRRRRVEEEGVLVRALDVEEDHRGAESGGGELRRD
mgnify:CR=1 FL=1